MCSTCRTIGVITHMPNHFLLCIFYVGFGGVMRQFTGTTILQVRQIGITIDVRVYVRVAVVVSRYEFT